MMMTPLRFIACLVCLVASVASFQFSPAVISQHIKSTVRANLIQNAPSPRFPTLLAVAEDEASTEKSSNSVNDLDKATFDIAKEYAETGMPGDSEKPGLQVDAFPIFLGCYFIFVITDTIFHITPDENYIDALRNFITGAAGNE